MSHLPTLLALVLNLLLVGTSDGSLPYASRIPSDPVGEDRAVDFFLPFVHPLRSLLEHRAASVGGRAWLGCFSGPSFAPGAPVLLGQLALPPRCCDPVSHPRSSLRDKSPEIRQPRRSKPVRSEQRGDSRRICHWPETLSRVFIPNTLWGEHRKASDHIEANFDSWFKAILTAPDRATLESGKLRVSGKGARGFGLLLDEVNRSMRMVQKNYARNFNALRARPVPELTRDVWAHLMLRDLW